MHRTSKKTVAPKRTNWGRRMEAIASPAFKRAFQAATKKYPSRKTCAHGHRLTNPKNVDVGSLLRTGRLNCYPCWQAIQKNYIQKVKADVVDKQPKNGHAGLSLAIPNDEALKLKEVVKFANSRYAQLPESAAARRRWVDKLVGLMLSIDNRKAAQRAIAPVQVPAEWQLGQVGAA